MRLRPALAVAVLLGVGMGCAETGSEPSAGRGASSRPGKAPQLAVVRSTTADRPGYPRYDIVLSQGPGWKQRVIAGDSLGRGARPVEFGRISWSPDGRRLTFAADLRRKSGFATDIYTTRADGSHQRRLTRTRDAFEPVWAPDGSTIVYVRRGPLPRRENDAFTSTLWSMRPNGSRPHRLTRSVGQVAETSGSFSPDSTSFLFTRAVFAGSGAPDPKASGLFVMDADGSDERRLIGDGGEPSYSPDGRRIAFISTRDRNGELNYGETVTPAAELYVMRADGTHERRLTHTRDLNEASPSWLPTGKRLAYQRGKQIENAEGMVVMQINPDGTCPRRLLADPRLDTWYNNPAWRPGGAGLTGARLHCR